MQRRKSCWLACSFLLLLGSGVVRGQAPSAAPADTTHWIVRVNKFRVLDIGVGQPNLARVPILKRADVLHVELYSPDTARTRHLVEVVDSKGLLVRRFEYDLALPGHTLSLPVAELLARRSFLQGRYRLQYANALGRRLALAEIDVAGTD